MKKDKKSPIHEVNLAPPRQHGPSPAAVLLVASVVFTFAGAGLIAWTLLTRPRKSPPASATPSTYAASPSPEPIIDDAVVVEIGRTARQYWYFLLIPVLVIFLHHITSTSIQRRKFEENPEIQIIVQDLLDSPSKMIRANKKAMTFSLIDHYIYSALLQGEENLVNNSIHDNITEETMQEFRETAAENITRLIKSIDHDRQKRGLPRLNGYEIKFYTYYFASNLARQIHENRESIRSDGQFPAQLRSYTLFSRLMRGELFHQLDAAVREHVSEAMRGVQFIFDTVPDHAKKVRKFMQEVFFALDELRSQAKQNLAWKRYDEWMQYMNLPSYTAKGRYAHSVSEELNKFKENVVGVVDKVAVGERQNWK